MLNGYGVIHNVARIATAAVCAAGLALVAARPAPLVAQAGAPPVRFADHAIAQQIAGGYQVIAVDLNKDKKLDVLALGTRAGELAWFENPSWERHVIATDLSNMINAAVRDIDGDLVPEIALAHGFTTNTETSRGVVSLLTHGTNLADTWTRRDIDALPTSHRLRWVNADGRRVMLVNSPLVGPGATPPDYRKPNVIAFYEGPDWKRQTLSEEEGLMHGIQPVQLPDGRAESLLAAGFAGIWQHQFKDGKWTKARLTGGDPQPWPKSGSSDVAAGHLGGRMFIAAIEPWHGNQVALYRQEEGSWSRQVLDDQITNGHALSTGDFAGDGRDAIVVGERNGRKSVYVYWPPAKLGDAWQRQVLDPAMAGAGCYVADLNADRRPDIACIQGEAPSIKWYENLGK
jgi:aldos-2-ulose dehydratase/isomerase family protein/VCBS repeat protein